MKKIFFILLFLTITIATFAQETQTIIVEQPDAPIVISEYNAEFKEGGSYTTEGIHHEIKFTNKTGLNVVAIQFGFVSFNVFNKYLDSMSGITMESIEMTESSDGTWIQSTVSDFSFYTGVTYLSKVRYSNDDIWEANLDLVSDRLEDIESDFDASVLVDSD